MIDLKKLPLVLALTMISPVGLLPVSGMLFTSAALADVTITSTDSTDDAAGDPSQEEDVRNSSEETCDELTSRHLRVSRC